MQAHIDAIGVVAKDLKQTLDFYTLLGFTFTHIGDGDHFEAVQENGLRLMIDTEKLLMSLGQPAATPASYSTFALKLETAGELNELAQKIKDAGHEIVMEPQDMFWGQRYATILDPNGNRIDLFAWLGQTPE